MDWENSTAGRTVCLSILMEQSQTTIQYVSPAASGKVNVL